MSVEEVERVLLYSLESSVSSDEQRRTEALRLICELESKVENAGPLFQLLLKYELNQESVSMAIIRILESHLISGSGISSQLRSAFVSDYVQKMILNPSKPIKQFFKNSICKFLLTAFVNEHLTGTWPDAIGSLLNIFKDSTIGRELFLKFCLILTEEIATSNGNVVKCEIKSKRDADLRDSMRVNDNGMLCAFWRQVLQEFRSEQEVVMTLECLAAFSSWIDVGLVVEGETLKLIYFLLQNQREPIQSAAADCLSEIVCKGMSAGDKISLANYMNLSSVFEAVRQRSLIDGFFSKICKVLSNLGTSLGQQIHLATGNMTASVQEQVVSYLCPVLLPQLLGFLELLTNQSRDKRIGSERWEESLIALLPFIGNTFEIGRSMRDKLRSDQTSFIGQFLPICLDLLEIPDQEASEACEEEGEDTSEFTSEIRVPLMQSFESVLWLQGHATLSLLNVLRKQEPLSLGRCEVLAKLVLRIPEGLRGNPTFSLTINGESRMTPISELVSWTVERVPESFPQLLPIITDVLVRYASTAYLDAYPDRVESGFRMLLRLMELRGFSDFDCDKLLRFVKTLKGKLNLFSVNLLTSLQGPLNSGSPRVLLPESVFEVAGMAVGSLDPRTIQLDGIMSPLLQQALTVSMCNEQVEAQGAALQCLASFAKGFMADSCQDPFPIRSWFRDYCREFLLERMMPGTMSISTANSLISFTQRMIPLLQGDSVPLVRELVMIILGRDELSIDSELMSLMLPLISAALFKLRDAFACPDILGNVWTLLVPRVHFLLTQKPIQGTDDIHQHLALSRSFLSLLQALSSTAQNLTLNRNNLSESIGDILIKIARTKSFTSVDNTIGLLRSLCGVLNRCQGCLSDVFLNTRIIPIIVNESIPSVFEALDPSSKRNLASLPAALLNLIQDFLVMIRSLHQNGRLTPETIMIKSINMIGGGEIKEIRTILIGHFISRVK